MTRLDDTLTAAGGLAAMLVGLTLCVLAIFG